MKGIVLAGGTGSRLYPLTKVTNKHLLPVGRKPMIYYPIEKMLEANIRDILIVTGTEHMGDVVGLLGSGRDFDCQFTYKVQDEAGGIAQALGLAEDFVHNDSMLVILGDNIFGASLKNISTQYSGKGARILIKQVKDPERYGVPELMKGKIIRIDEKPEHPKSNYCVTGIYFYDNEVFDVIRSLKPSIRGELEISDVNNFYINEGKMYYSVLDGWWTDAGTHESYRLANEHVNKEII